MRILDIFSETLSAILSKKGRTILTILGIVIGIGSVVAMLSIGNSAKSSLEGDIKQWGANILQVYPDQAKARDNKKNIQGFTDADAEAILKLNGVKEVFLLNYGSYSVSVGKTKDAAIVYASDDKYIEANKNNIFLESGNFFTESHVKNYSKVVLIGSEVKESLFGAKDAINEPIKINNVNFKVIGIINQNEDNFSFNKFNDKIFIPLSTFNRYVIGSKYSGLLWANLEEGVDAKPLKDEVQQALKDKRGIKDDINYFSVDSSEDMLGFINSFTSIFTILLAAIAGISLLVGGIGIMNMMLTIVNERTKEIGLRKAIGAKPSDISTQFLIEAIFLTIVGGIFGILLGMGLSAVVTSFMKIENIISFDSILLAFSISAFIGIAFGYYPARRASKLNPIEALRYE